MNEAFLNDIRRLMEASSKAVAVTEETTRNLFKGPERSDETAILLLQLEMQGKQLAVLTGILAALTCGRGELCESNESQTPAP